jgi:L-asparagine oxygenase
MMNWYTTFHNHTEAQRTLVLTDGERADIAEVVFGLRRWDPHEVHPDIDFIRCRSAAGHFPERVVQALDEFRSRPDRFEDGVLIIRNLPMEADPGPTPSRFDVPINRTTTVAENVIICLATLHGEPFVPSYEQGGRQPGLVAPVQGEEELPINGSSKGTFAFHIENAIDGDCSPDGISLLTIRPDQNGEAATTTASLYHALQLLSAPALAILRKPLFEVSKPDSFVGDIDPMIVPVLAGSDRYPTLRYRAYGFRPLTDLAAEALHELDVALISVKREDRSVRGDYILVNNKICVHGRTSFRAYWDERQASNRYLLRVYSTLNWSAVRDCCYPNTHMLVPTQLVRGALGRLVA